MKEKMIGVFSKTFGGLDKSYYFRHLVFGVALAVLFIFLGSRTNHGLDIGFISMAIINTLLYPYSRFVYESVMGFIMGNNVFYNYAIVILIAKLFTMTLCWGAAIFIAPIGLLYLFYYHTKNNSSDF